MPLRTSGLHHVSAIAGDPQANIDFCEDVLGLRLVKRTVNFDAPDTYHLYYGDDDGRPGTIMTYFPWTNILFRGTAAARRGTGQVVATAFAVAPGSVEFWVDRLARMAVDFDVDERLGEEVIGVLDPDGIQLEIVTVAATVDAAEDARSHRSRDIPAEHAIRGLAGVTISLGVMEATSALLTDLLGFRLMAEDGSRYRFETAETGLGRRIDLLNEPDLQPGIGGVGAVHHIALRADNEEQQREWRQLLLDAGYDVSPILDRQYFRSIYFREHGGVLFEIATDGPGFDVDEPQVSLGERLTLPPWLEPRRASIEARLPVLRVNPGRGE